MSDITNQKQLREFCNLGGCEVWKAIQALEEPRLQPRSTLRRFCAEKCSAYAYTKFLDAGNLKIARKTGHAQYHC